MTKQQKTWFGIIITIVVIIGIIVSVLIIGSKNKQSDINNEALEPIEEQETIESETIESEIIVEEPIEAEESVVEEIEPEEEVVVEDYIEQEDVLKQELSEEDLKIRDEQAAEYVAEKSSTDIQPPFESMLARISQDYDAIKWEEVYLTKGNFIWWLEEDATNKVDVPYNIDILADKGVINIYVMGNQEDTEKVKATLDKWIASMVSASAYSETGIDFTINYHAEQ